MEFAPFQSMMSNQSFGGKELIPNHFNVGHGTYDSRWLWFLWRRIFVNKKSRVWHLKKTPQAFCPCHLQQPVGVSMLLPHDDLQDKSPIVLNSQCRCWHVSWESLSHMWRLKFQRGDWNASLGQIIQCCFPYSALGRYLSFLYDLKFHTQIPKTLCFKEKKIRLQWFYITHRRLITYSNLFHSPYCKLRLLGLAPDQHPFLQAAQHTHGWALPSKGLSHIPMQVLIRTILSRTNSTKLTRHDCNYHGSPRLVTTQKW